MAHIHYKLRVASASKKVTGIVELTNLTMIQGIPTLGVICLQPANANEGTGDAAYGSANVLLPSSRIKNIRNQVNDNNASYHVTVEFDVSSETLTGFINSYST